MKKLIFAVFAHPDDEAFGPSGTLLQEIAAGNEVHLITLTAGEAGRNPDNFTDIAAVRLAEWRTCGELMGVHSMKQLGYRDGYLGTKSMEEITEKIESNVRQKIAGHDGEYEFLAYELNGLSGHIDHIVASRATAAVFYRLKQSDQPPTRLRLFCIARKWMPETDVTWLYREPGCPPEHIDEVVDARKQLAKIHEIIRAHHSQREDAAIHLAQHDEALYLNHYRVLR